MDDSASGKKPKRKLLIALGAGILAAAATAGVAAAALFAINAADRTIIESEQGNPPGLSLRVGGTSYFVMSDYDTGMFAIVRIDDRADATAQEMYRVSFPQEGFLGGGISLLFEKNGILYFRESCILQRDGQSMIEATMNPYCELKSLDLRKENSKPLTIELKLKPGVSIPAWVIDELEFYHGSGLPLELFLINSVPEKEYSYLLVAEGTESSKAVLFKINCMNGEVECREGGSVRAGESWAGTRMVRDGFVYFEKYLERERKGFSRVDMLSYSEEFLVAYPTGRQYLVGSTRVVDGLFYYSLFDPSSYSTFSRGYYYELHCFNLNTRKDTLLLAGESFGAYLGFALYDKLVYYSDREGIHRCDANGDNYMMLVRNGNSRSFSGPWISGEWLYFFSEHGEMYRIRLNGEGEPVRVYSLTSQ